MVDDLIVSHRVQLDRLLDLYLGGEFPREALTKRKSRLETTISALGREQAGLRAHVTAQAVSDDQIRSLQDFVQKVAASLDVANGDSATRRRVIEVLDVEGTLAIEDGERAIYVRCVLGHNRLIYCQLAQVSINNTSDTEVALGARLTIAKGTARTPS